MREQALQGVSTEPMAQCSRLMAHPLPRRGIEEEGRIGMRWMPWRRVPMKDVGSCDKHRGASNQAVIR